jgi:hypothetical protein
MGLCVVRFTFWPASFQKRDLQYPLGRRPGLSHGHFHVVEESKILNTLVEKINK